MHDALYLDRPRLRSGCFSRRREDVQDEINDGNNKQEGEGTRGANNMRSHAMHRSERATAEPKAGMAIAASFFEAGQDE